MHFIANPRKFEAPRHCKSSKIWNMINDDPVSVITVLWDFFTKPCWFNEADYFNHYFLKSFIKRRIYII